MLQRWSFRDLKLQHASAARGVPVLTAADELEFVDTALTAREVADHP